MNYSVIPGDYQLWRDLKWHEYLKSQLPKYESELEKQELRDAVGVARQFACIFSTMTPCTGDIRGAMEIEDRTPKHTLVLAMIILAQIAGIYYRGKRRCDDQLTFSITAISKAAERCREGQFDKVLPILTRFAKEFSDE